MAKKKKDLKKIILSYKNALSNDIRVDSIILFGSYAKGNAKKNSDIDVAVVSPDFEKKNPIKNLQFLFKIAKNVDVDLEPLAFLPEEIKNPDSRSFESDILRNGKIVYRK
ncbi:nucleotidyltransferase domain-containing protein [Candidatus Margulisiibacteriota bacterium]